MLMMHSRIAARILTPLSFLAMPIAVAGQNNAPPNYSYHYFKEKVSLNCDTTRVALFESAPKANPGAALTTSAAKFGIKAEALSKSQVPSMWVAASGNLTRDAAAAERLLSSIAADNDIGFASPVFLDGRGDPVIMTQYLHVGFDKKTSADAAEALLAKMGAGQIESANWAGMPGVYRIRCHTRDGFKVLELANAIAADPSVLFAEPDMILTTRKSLIPNDTFFNILWGLHNTGQSGGTVDMDMDCPEAWDLTTGDPAIITVILDDGTQQNHPDINQIPGADFTGSGTGGGPFNQCDNHGTAVAGCTSATINNSLGVVGSAPNCKVAAAKWNIANLGTPCPGTGSFAISWFVNALGHAQTIGARVTNNSNGFGPSGSITTKYQQTRDAGIIHFAASGNDGTSVIGYPASLPTVNAVGAINRFGNKASFSTFGNGLAFVAPGQEIGSTDRTGSAGYVSGDYVLIDGTSFASPYAAGVAALVLSVDDTLLPADVEQIMNSTCTDRGAAGYDTLYGWGIVNAFGAAQAAMPDTLTLSGSCFYDVAMTNPVNTVAVQVINLNSGASFTAGTNNNDYTLDLDTTTEVSDGDTLRYIAKDGVEFINVTDRVVTQADLLAGGIAMDLVLDEFYLDLADFPMYEADGPNHNDYSGAAVAQMLLNYIWWDSDIDPTPPLLFDDQSALYAYGISQNATASLTVFDPVGMRATIQNNRPLPYSQFGYNFSIRQDTDSTEILKQVAQWVAYEIGTVGGHEPGHPLHVPGVIPAYGDYSNWMAVRGIHTSEDAYPLPDPLDVFGFWVNDPLPSAFGGIGENSYKTVAELLATYYLPLTTGDAYDGKYVAIVEPPDAVHEKVLTIVPSPLRFIEPAKTDVDLLRAAKDPTPAVLEAANAWVVQAAIDGVSEQLIPYDDAFAARWSQTKPGTPLLVERSGDLDYFAVPFLEAKGDGDANTAIVVLINADTGSFSEAAWVEQAVVYPPVSRDRARAIAREVLDKNGVKAPDFESATTKLVYQGSTPYHPHWQISGAGYVILVGQDGSAALTIIGR